MIQIDRNYMHLFLVFLAISIGLIYISSQLILGQSNLSNTGNKVKVPSHLDIESQSTEQEMAAIRNSPSNSTNTTGQLSNNSTNNATSQSLQEFTNGTMNGSGIFTNRSANFWILKLGITLEWYYFGLYPSINAFNSSNEHGFLNISLAPMCLSLVSTFHAWEHALLIPHLFLIDMIWDKAMDIKLKIGIIITLSLVNYSSALYLSSGHQSPVRYSDEKL